MPRGHKSKLRARAKRHQARSEIQATAAEEKDVPFCSDNLQNVPDVHHSQQATTTSESASCTKSDEDFKNRDEERQDNSQVLPTTDLPCTSCIEDIAILVVHFMLQKYKKGEPIKKEDIVTHVIPQNEEMFDEIFKKCSELLVLSFGIDVKEVDQTEHSYVLVSMFNPIGDVVLEGEDIMPRNGLLTIMLCIIFMKGNRATEKYVWEVLEMLGICQGVNHFIFGDVKKFITKDLVREKYLNYELIPNSSPPRYQFLWGARAHVETSKMRVLEFLAKIEGSEPSEFPALYEMALRDEEERSRARFAAMLFAGILASIRARSINSTTF